jgi:hypothetical protein
MRNVHESATPHPASLGEEDFDANHAGDRDRARDARVRRPGAGRRSDGFVKADDAKYEVVREMAEAARKLAAPK